MEKENTLTHAERERERENTQRNNNGRRGPNVGKTEPIRGAPRPRSRSRGEKLSLFPENGRRDRDFRRRGSVFIV